MPPSKPPSLPWIFSGLACALSLLLGLGCSGSDEGSNEKALASYGKLCQGSSDCESGLCLILGSVSLCGARCPTDSCPRGDPCVTAGGMKVCKPSTGGMILDGGSGGTDMGGTARDSNALPRPDKKCTPNCAGKKCGPDGCGGTCGSCSQYQSCSSTGTCAWRCSITCNYNSGFGSSKVDMRCGNNNYTMTSSSANQSISTTNLNCKAQYHSFFNSVTRIDCVANDGTNHDLTCRWSYKSSGGAIDGGYCYSTYANDQYGRTICQ